RVVGMRAVHLEGLAAARVGHVEPQHESGRIAHQPALLVARRGLAEKGVLADPRGHLVQPAQVVAIEGGQGLGERAHFCSCSSFFSNPSIFFCSFSTSCASAPAPPPSVSSACFTLWSTLARSSSTAFWPAASTSLTGSAESRRSRLVTPRTFCSRFSRSASVRFFISSMRSESLLATLSW